MMARAGLHDLTPEQVKKLMSAYLAGRRRAWVERGHHAATGWQILQVWIRTDDGRPIKITGRVMPPDFYITDVRLLTPAETAEFTHWEESDPDERPQS